MPGFAVLLVHAGVFSGLGYRVDVDYFSSGKYFYRNYIPDLQRGYVGDYEIYVVDFVGYGAGAGGLADAYGVAVFVSRAGGEDRLDLNAQDAGAALEQEVVRAAVSVGAGRGEAEGGGFEDESQFADFSVTAGIEAGLAGGDIVTLGWWVEVPRVIWHVAGNRKGAGLS